MNRVVNNVAVEMHVISKFKAHHKLAKKKKEQAESGDQSLANSTTILSSSSRPVTAQRINSVGQPSRLNSGSQGPAVQRMNSMSQPPLVQRMNSGSQPPLSQRMNSIGPVRLNSGSHHPTVPMSIAAVQAFKSKV